MPTPNRGYIYPATSSPATVPADLRAPLEAIDADVQMLADQMSETVRLNPDGTLPEGVESRVEVIAREFGSPIGMIPIFPTLAEAQAWMLANPGREAFTREAPPDPGAWQAAAPAFDVVAQTYTIPSDAGATYSVAGVVKAAGTHAVVAPVTVTVVATARPGYSLVGVTEWVQEFVEITSPYEGQVFAFNPQHYWRLDEPTVPIQDRGAGGTVTTTQVTDARLGWAGVGVGSRAAQASYPFLWTTGISTATEYTIAGVTTIAPSSVTQLITHADGPQLSYDTGPSGADGQPLNRLRFGAKGTPGIISDRVLNLAAGAIVHAAITRSGGTVRAYINGVEVASAPAQTITDSYTRVGQLNTTTERVGGIVVELTKAASPAQIAAMSAAVQR